MTSNRTLAILALVLSGIFSLHAQPAAVQQLQNNQLSQQLQVPGNSLTAGTNAPDLFPGENEDVGPQRILRIQPRNNYFDVVLDSQFFVSDNANFDIASRAISSAVYVNTVQAAFAPPAWKIGPGNLSAVAGFSSQWYNYDASRLALLDFDAQTVFLNGKYLTKNWQFGLGINATRLVNQSDYSETYRELMPNFGMQRNLPINDRMFFSIGDIVDYHFTQVPKEPGTPTGINDRLDNVPSVTFTWMALSHLVIQPYYRFQYSYYQHNTLAQTDRTDRVHSCGITAAYFFNNSLSLRAYFNYNRRWSDDKFTPAYEELNGGLGLSLDWKF